jgi:hypothetical protein
MPICKSCEKRKECTSLCPKAYAYANQDYVPQTAVFLEDNIGDFDPPWFLSANHTEEITNFDFLTPLENRILSMFYLRRLTYAQIAIAMSGHNKYKMSRKGVDYRLSKAKSKILGVFSYNKGP